jgi:hypothetical protein
MFSPRDALAHHAEHVAVVLRDAVADGVGQVEGGGAGLDGDLADLDEEVGSVRVASSGENSMSSQ